MATDTLPHASIIGAAVPRIDGPLKTSGTARYACDHDFPGLVHAVAGAEPPSARGAFASLDTSAAEKMPGVLLVLHHGNHERAFTAPFRMRKMARMAETRPPFDDDNIYYWGQYVAAGRGGNTGAGQCRRASGSR